MPIENNDTCSYHKKWVDWFPATTTVSAVTMATITSTCSNLSNVDRLLKDILNNMKDESIINPIIPESHAMSCKFNFGELVIVVIKKIKSQVHMSIMSSCILSQLFKQ